MIMAVIPGVFILRVPIKSSQILEKFVQKSCLDYAKNLMIKTKLKAKGNGDHKLKVKLLNGKSQRRIQIRSASSASEDKIVDRSVHFEDTLLSI